MFNHWKALWKLSLSLLIAAIVCNYKGDEWENSVRNGLYFVKHDSIPDFAAEYLDAQGVPFVYYPEQNGITAGKQYNATIVCNYALKYYQLQKHGDTAARTKFFNCANWLSFKLTRRDNYALYIFNWTQPWYDSVGAPFTSGMTSGRAIEVFVCADSLVHSTAYLNNAKLLIRGFYQPIDSGGFTYKSNNGWWFEELADTAMHSPYILDGHIFALLGVHKYWLATKDDSAAFVFQQGLRSLKQQLPKYNAPKGWSYYDKYQKPSDKKYHRILTAQMKQLWEITGDPYFQDYYKRWNAPLQQFYVLRTFKELNRSGIILYLLITLCIATLLIAVNKILPPKPGSNKLIF